MQMMGRASVSALLVAMHVAGYARIGMSQQISGVLLKPVTCTLKDTTMDHALIQVAKTAGINVMLDATPHIERKPQAGDLNDILGYVLVAVCRENKLGVLQCDDQMFLFWTLPDLRALMDQVKQGAAIEELTDRPDEEKLSAMVKSYFRDSGMAGDHPGFELSMPIMRLPQPFAKLLTAYTQGEVLHPNRVMGMERNVTQANMPKLPTVFDKDFWDNTRIWFKDERSVGRKIRMFTFGFEQHPELKGGCTAGWEF